VPTTGTHYYDRTGRTISRAAWETLSGQPGYSHVALDVVTIRYRTVQVHTFWTGVPRRSGNHQSTNLSIFRTVVYGLGCAVSFGWADQVAATAGHIAATQLIIAYGGPPLYGPPATNNLPDEDRDAPPTVPDTPCPIY
jgi:hypothetical protein